MAFNIGSRAWIQLSVFVGGRISTCMVCVLISLPPFVALNAASGGQGKPRTIFQNNIKFGFKQKREVRKSHSIERNPSACGNTRLDPNTYQKHYCMSNIFIFLKD